MTDWADEIASDLFYKGFTLKAIATALRKARSDALEEAERAVGNCNEDGSWTNSCNCKAAIRALKDKQP